MEADPHGRPPPPQERFSLKEQSEAFVYSSQTMPPELYRLCEAANAVSFPGTPVLELKKLIADLVKALDTFELDHGVTIHAKLTSLYMYLAMHENQSRPDDEGTYEDVL